jgi:RHS repeat-associated protein
LLQQKRDISGTPKDDYPLCDLLYRAVALTDNTGALIEAYDTDAYGNTIVFSAAGTGSNWFADDATTTDTPKSEFIYTGRRFDPETEIYFYRARYYVPELERVLKFSFRRLRVVWT